MIYFLKEFGRKETFETFRLHKYVNVFQLPIAYTDIMINKSVRKTWMDFYNKPTD